MEQKINHGQMVFVLAKSGATIAAEMTPHGAHLIHMVLGISGEAGELLDAIKKSVIYNKPLDVVNVIEELGDIEFYLEGLRQRIGITREQTIDANIAKLAKRYEGFKYSDGAAQARADKVEPERVFLGSKVGGTDAAVNAQESGGDSGRHG